ncbi:PLP-dependent aspartate aminotransferase family protein [Tessaracoccus sp. OH4464_COT-324]|uniref:trans-sulfuration enzyme family protein n=1 Tax=Tessaracoccus sp. OH4464_COT-324 TaxID=2491059 RepID=UPI000F62E0DD|nr:PLP-dependent transferase [Tessaracoccus sp. OH4464_COT-324]RRD46738.1 O-succinylhomoserine (thiol)-lyase [Tessaracoccus sp. OH4464_COT-324]
MSNSSRWTRAVGSGLGADTGWEAAAAPSRRQPNQLFALLSQGPEDRHLLAGDSTWDALNAALATLECGAGAVAVTSGPAAATLLVEALVPAGGRVVASANSHGGAWRLLTMFAERSRLRLTLVPTHRPEALGAALAEEASLLWVETPSNPLLRVTDIAEAVRLGHAAGATVVVDNTFCTPLLQQPLTLGADVAVHSTTRFIAGHSDVVGGAAIAREPQLADELARWAGALGIAAGSFDAYLTVRGLSTLDARLRVHAENTLAVVDTLDGHPAVAALHYPGLPDHPESEVVQRQMASPGSIVSFELGGGRAAVERFLDGLEVFQLAGSLGGAESSVCHPATMTHAALAPGARHAAGITEGLLQLSVGLEARGDIVEALSSATERALGVGHCAG